MEAQFSFIVSSKQNDLRLLDVLLPMIPYRTAEQWRGILQRGLITIDDVVVVEDSILKVGQTIEYVIKDHEEGDVDTRWHCLWEGDDIIAVHKPANLPVNRTTRNVYNTLIQLVRRETQWRDANLLHRLDYETSGVLLIAKNKAATKYYQPKIHHFIEKKIYWAWVSGMPSWDTQDFICDLDTVEGSPIRSQMHVVPSGTGKPSRTQFTVLQRFPSSSLIQCELLSGRKHQIRAHLSVLGHPIIGDKIYSNDGQYYLKRLEKTLTAADEDLLKTDHHLLHAYRLDFVVGDQKISVTDDFMSEEWQRWKSSLQQ